MKLFQRIFFATVLAGLVAGGLMAALQQWRVAPLILAAELYEEADAGLDHGSPPGSPDAAAPAGHEHGGDEWKPAEGAERIGFTVAADLLAGIGFAFGLAAVSVLGELPVTPRNGLLWGLCGFLAFQLAPALGLPPELPGMPVADLGARQVWWLGTALCTGLACYGIARYRNIGAILLGALLLLAPHLIGAPPSPETSSSVPAHLASSFAAGSLAAAAVFWLSLGPLYGWLLQRFAEPRTKALSGVRA